MQSASSNRRLAKNTLAMYIRMLFLMFIGFYTSRVVLKALGADDFGIYNLVGGVVVLFTFINSAMTTATQRHLSYEYGAEGGDVSRVFSACLNIHLILAAITLVLSETIGLWFVNTKLNFPEGRMWAVNWVYQFTIIACIFNIVRVPYNALIIANERMTFYAYVGIIEGILKLAIAFLLAVSPLDKLVFYALLITVVVGIVTAIFYLYCKNKLEGGTYVKVRDKALYSKLLGFSGWTVFGSFANLARSQGLSFLINMFYGVALNAALGLANQVNSALSQFVYGFQQAFSPQLTKLEASSDKAQQQTLIDRTSKFSFFILLVLSIPVLYNLHYLLGVWLGDYPEYTYEFCYWIVIATLIDSISGPLWVSIFATGEIKSYQIAISILLLMNLPLAYLCGKLGWKPQYMFVCQALINLLAVAVRLFYLKRTTTFSIQQFARDVLLPIFLVALLLVPLVYTFYKYISTATGLLQFICQSAIIVMCELGIVWLLGLSREERRGVLSICHSKGTYTGR